MKDEDTRVEIGAIDAFWPTRGSVAEGLEYFTEVTFASSATNALSAAILLATLTTF